MNLEVQGTIRIILVTRFYFINIHIISITFLGLQEQINLGLWVSFTINKTIVTENEDSEKPGSTEVNQEVCFFFFCCAEKYVS